MIVSQRGENMIYLTKNNREKTRFALNHRLIERIEEHGDTHVYLTNSSHYIVAEKTEEIIESIIKFESNLTPCGQTKRSEE